MINVDQTENKIFLNYPEDYAAKSFESEIDFEKLNPVWEKQVLENFENLKNVILYFYFQ